MERKESENNEKTRSSKKPPRSSISLLNTLASDIAMTSRHWPPTRMFQKYYPQIKCCRDTNTACTSTSGEQFYKSAERD